MDNGANISAFAEACVEEKLMFSILIGPPEQCKELLDSLEHVDVRMLRQRTLLHVGVSLGKVEWVEELLGRGADPNLKDGSDVTALQLAEEILRKYPDDSDRRQVSRLMRLVKRRDQAMRRRTETSFVVNTLTSTCPVIEEEHVNAMAHLSSSVDALKEEMRLLRTELRSYLEKLKELVCGMDALLRCLEAAVTSSSEQLTSLSGRLLGEAAMAALGSTLETLHPLPNMADERRECVDCMLRKTEVAYGGEEGVRRVRKLYEWFYDRDEATACLLKFLRRECSFVAKVDCGSPFIGRMKERFVGWDGEEFSESHGYSFAEFSSNTMYFGARLDDNWSERKAVFAWVLAEMSLHLCFHNGGKPYEVGDGVHEAEWRRVFEEAAEGMSGLDWRISDALCSGTREAKDCLLAASVPLIIARYGSTKGTRMLRDKVPRLLDFYKEHVVATLLAKARE